MAGTEDRRNPATSGEVPSPSSDASNFIRANLAFPDRLRNLTSADPLISEPARNAVRKRLRSMQPETRYAVAVGLIRGVSRETQPQRRDAGVKILSEIHVSEERKEALQKEYLQAVASLSQRREPDEDITSRARTLARAGNAIRSMLPRDRVSSADIIRTWSDVAKTFPQVEDRQAAMLEVSGIFTPIENLDPRQIEDFRSWRNGAIEALFENEGFNTLTISKTLKVNQELVSQIIRRAGLARISEMKTQSADNPKNIPVFPQPKIEEKDSSGTIAPPKVIEQKPKEQEQPVQPKFPTIQEVIQGSDSHPNTNPFPTIADELRRRKASIRFGYSEPWGDEPKVFDNDESIDAAEETRPRDTYNGPSPEMTK